VCAEWIIEEVSKVLERENYTEMLKCENENKKIVSYITSVLHDALYDKIMI